MSLRGKCRGGSVAVAFFGSTKKEGIKKHIYRNRALATEGRR